MKKISLSSTITILFLFFLIASGLCLDGNEIIKLRQAGIGDDTIQLMVREKTTETCAFTVQEIIDLKEAGLGDETIQALIREGSFLKEREPVVYGKDIRSVNFTTAKDIIWLKDAGVSDETIQAIITVGSDHATGAEREKAWEMLRNMGIIIDARKAGK